MSAPSSTSPAVKKFGGLTTAEVVLLQQQYGTNSLKTRQSGRLTGILKNVVREPMFLLLLSACVLYFLLDSFTEGFMTMTAMLLVTLISVYQESKSARALDALKQYTAPLTTVIRDGKEVTIPTAELVPGDIILLQEGEMIPADANILEANDLTINESIITGESFPVDKPSDGHFELYQGTTVNSGACVAQVTATGNNTVLGKLGKSMEITATGTTLLQRQINVFVRRLALFGIIGFSVVCAINFIRSGNITSSLLSGLTLAMAAIPEEIPVAFSSFMALGAFYMSRMGIIPKRAATVEYLGSASVLCLDKTGTITENKMQVVQLYDQRHDTLVNLETTPPADNRLLYLAALASERHPFDAMEQAIWIAFSSHDTAHTDMPGMIYEYPLEGRPPMMTHVYKQGDISMAAAKGAVERILHVCHSDSDTVKKIRAYANEMGEKGYRVLGIASALIQEDTFPASQDDLDWQLEGMVALYDPPRKEAAPMIAGLYKAGIRVCLITGDYPATAMYVASRTGIRHSNHCITGDEVMEMSDVTLKEVVRQESLYARMFPEAKLKVIEALKANREIVAMTGDGVNDGPALKAAHIGIAMGKKGTEIARLAADLVITDDNLGKIPVAIEQGRKTYNNLKKAVRYIISIHIPIILTTTLPLILGWKYPNIFTPIHIIFLELIMGPTCSLFYEKEPAESNIMYLPPRGSSTGLFTGRELFISIVQGLVITAGVLSVYASGMVHGSLEATRTMAFLTLVFSNIFLTFTNRSFTETFLSTVRYPNRLVPAVVSASLLFIMAIYFIPPVRNIFGLTSVGGFQFFLCVIVAFFSVTWFEMYKGVRLVLQDTRRVA